MTYSLDSGIDSTGSFASGSSLEYQDLNVRHSGDSHHAAGARAFHLLRDKLQIPPVDDLIDRPRLDTILKRSMEQFPATLISGRAGTGKTALAAAFASREKNAAWFAVESSDRNWPIFRRYFAEFISPESAEDVSKVNAASDAEFEEVEAARYLINGFIRSYREKLPIPKLLVMDDIHHIFDAEWFDDFFHLLLHSLPAETHLLMLCRSKPPGPLWRLRSKQMLNVLDERVIAFNESEAERLFSARGIFAKDVRGACRTSYGRVSKLLQFVEKPC